MPPSKKTDAATSEDDDGLLNYPALEAAALKLGITGVEQIAKHAEISRSHMFRMKSGEVGASVRTGLKLARRYRTTVERLFTGAGAAQ